jgi:hypothetical protein
MVALYALARARRAALRYECPVSTVGQVNRGISQLVRRLALEVRRARSRSGRRAGASPRAALAPPSRKR